MHCVWGYLISSFLATNIILLAFYANRESKNGTRGLLIVIHQAVNIFCSLLSLIIIKTGNPEEKKNCRYIGLWTTIFTSILLSAIILFWNGLIYSTPLFILSVSIFALTIFITLIITIFFALFFILVCYFFCPFLSEFKCFDSIAPIKYTEKPTYTRTTKNLYSILGIFLFAHMIATIISTIIEWDKIKDYYMDPTLNLTGSILTVNIINILSSITGILLIRSILLSQPINTRVFDHNLVTTFNSNGSKKQLIFLLQTIAILPSILITISTIYTKKIISIYLTSSNTYIALAIILLCILYGILYILHKTFCAEVCTKQLTDDSYTMLTAEV